MSEPIRKYPRTPHIEGSRLQAGDEDLLEIPVTALRGRHTVVEEKVDGANVAVSFQDGALMLQSRGHFLRGGARERHYELFKVWAAERRAELYSILGERYIMYGEWLYAKHKVYYNALPDFFLEFDIFDRESGEFLDTGSRSALLRGSSVYSVPVLYEGEITSHKQLTSLITDSRYIEGDHLAELMGTVEKMGLDPREVADTTDGSHLAEGLYIKIEEDGVVKERMKFVRAGYVQTAGIEERWHTRPIIPNKLKK